MNQDFNEQIVTSSSSTSNVSPNINPSLCLVCHQPLLPKYYFCPNCGTKISSTLLSTSVGTQIWIYAFSIIIPMIFFILIGKWPGTKYSKSNDPKAKQIGYIAWGLLILSTIVTVWLSIRWTNQMIQSSMNSLNGALGGL